MKMIAFIAMILLLSSSSQTKKELEKADLIIDIGILIVVSLFFLIMGILFYNIFIESYKAGKFS